MRLFTTQCHLPNSVALGDLQLTITLHSHQIDFGMSINHHRAKSNTIILTREIATYTPRMVMEPYA